MAKLAQYLAVYKGAKNKAESILTKAYQNLSKTEPLKGFSRVHRPLDSEAPAVPSENSKVQTLVSAVIANIVEEWSNLINVSFAIDRANQAASADIVVDGVVLAAKVPVTQLLFLEKKLTDIHTFVSKLPTLSSDATWTFNKDQGYYVTSPVETRSIAKVMKNHVKSPATDKHPAQVEVFTEDVTTGYWTKVQFSSEYPATTVASLLKKVESLQKAVLFAREEANTQVVETSTVGDALLGYIFK
jgi:hypothetical protein